MTREMESLTYSTNLEGHLAEQSMQQLPREEKWGYVQEDRAFIDAIVEWFTAPGHCVRWSDVRENGDAVYESEGRTNRWSYCRGGPPWPPQLLALLIRTGGHGGPPSQFQGVHVLISITRQQPLTGFPSLLGCCHVSRGFSRKESPAEPAARPVELHADLYREIFAHSKEAIAIIDPRRFLPPAKRRSLHNAGLR